MHHAPKIGENAAKAVASNIDELIQRYDTSDELVVYDAFEPRETRRAQSRDRPGGRNNRRALLMIGGKSRSTPSAVHLQRPFRRPPSTEPDSSEHKHPTDSAEPRG